MNGRRVRRPERPQVDRVQRVRFLDIRDAALSCCSPDDNLPAGVKAPAGKSSARFYLINVKSMTLATTLPPADT